MRYYKLFLVLVAVGFLSSSTLVFSQENSAPGADPAPQGPAPAIAKQDTPGPTEVSIYGEVQAVDQAANSLTVQYYDYDGDEERTVEIVASADTKIENATSIAGINKGDWVDATYTLSDGKNIAKSIIVEKEEEPIAAGTEENPQAELPEEE